MSGRIVAAGVVYALLWTSLAAQEAPSEPRLRIDYVVDVSNPGQRTVDVSMKIQGVDRDPLILSIPTWRPGSYRFQRYHTWYESVSAVGAEGGKLEVSKKNDITYEIKTGGAHSLTVNYVLKPRRNDLNKEHFHIDAVGVYPYLFHYKRAPCRVRFELPESWEVATGLEKRGEWYVARDYDTFADCPTELGIFTLRTFKHGGALYEIMIHGPTDFDVDAFVEMHEKIVAEQVRMMGGAPYDRYVFLYHLANRFGGYGLEHLNSTIIYFGAQRLKSNVKSIASLTSHEFFHLWNVKRIRPKVLGPFDYTKDVRTRALWWAEGVTDYYAHLTLVRAGVITRPQFYRQMGLEICQLQLKPDRLRTSVEQASWKYWDGYRRVSVYNKGLLLGMLIDLRMRRLTRDRKNLDDVVRFLDGWFVKGGGGPIGVGFEEGDLLRAVNAVSGHDFTDFFEKYVSGTHELPYKKVLGGAGLDLTVNVEIKPTHGMRLRRNTVRGLIDNGPAQKAGVKRGDKIIAVNGEEVDARSLRGALGDLEAGAKVTLTVERDGSEEKIPFQMGEREKVSECLIDPVEDPTPLMKAIRSSWLSGSEE